MDAIREVRWWHPGANYFGSAHTYRNFESAFLGSSDVLDYKTFETWAEGKARRGHLRASPRPE